MFLCIVSENQATISLILTNSAVTVFLKAGFLLPILHTLLLEQTELSCAGDFPITPECLILAPTRELAQQIHKEAMLYASDTVVKAQVAYGGTAIFHQKNALRVRI